MLSSFKEPWVFFALTSGSVYTSNIAIVFLSCWSNKKRVCIAAVKLGKFSVWSEPLGSVHRQRSCPGMECAWHYVVLWKVNWALLCQMAAPSAVKSMCHEQPLEDFVLPPSNSLAFSSSHVYLYKLNLWKQDSMSKSDYLVWLSSFSRKRCGYCTHSSPSHWL